MIEAAAVPAGVPSAASRSQSASETSASWVASSGTTDSSRIPLRSTIRAASGSAQMLNSAAAVAFARAWPPPISTSRGIRCASPGSRSSAVAMFVSGPVGTSTTSEPSANAVDEELAPPASPAPASAPAAGRGSRRGSSAPASAWSRTAVEGTQRARRAAVDGRLDADVVEHAQGVLGRVLDRGVARRRSSPRRARGAGRAPRA